MLTQTGCQARQARLRQALADQNIDAAVISDPHEIYYFTGVLLPLTPFAPPALLWIDARSAWLIAPWNMGEPVLALDDFLTYKWSINSTASPDWLRSVNALLAARLSGMSAKRIGWQSEALPYLLAMTIDAVVDPDEWLSIDDVINHMERRKDPDEIALIRKSIEIDIAAYRAAAQAIRPGVNELDVLAAAQQAAFHAAGEAVYHNGDYQSGEFGGTARNRQVEAGELYIVDAWTRYHGYWSDMSRAFIVGDVITDVQQSLFDHVKHVQEAVPGLLKPGIDGTEVWRKVDALIREHPLFAQTGLVHHAGHSLGLHAHEMPDLNPERGGILEVGNILSVEPGAYLDAARVGARLENMYLITESGAELLSDYPIRLR